MQGQSAVITDLNKGLVETPQMRRHMPHADQTGQKRERSRQLINHEAVLHTELILRLNDVVIHIMLHLVNLGLNLILRHFHCRIELGQGCVEQILDRLLRRK